MALATELLIFGLVTLILLYLLGQRKPKNFPPGPWGFPIIGHMPLLGLEGHKTVIEWKPKYGPIIGLDFASFRSVIISDYKLVKEAMNEITFSGRPKLPFFLDRSGGTPEGIIFTDGNKWQEQRRFTLRHLRDFGFGTKSMEVIVHDEIVELIERLKTQVGQPISTLNRFNVAVVNALWTILAGERFKQDDPALEKIIEITTTSFQEVDWFTQLCSVIPFVAKYGPEFITGYKGTLAAVQPTLDFLQPFIDQHFETHQLDNPRDFLDTYIDEMKKTKDPSSSFHIDKIRQLKFTILDLFMAGTETTSTTLTWILLYMAKFPKLQEKLALEIQQVVGNSRLPSLTDRASMPYTEAVIHEVMRAATLVPLSVMHSTTEDVQFHGYDLPKDTMIFINLYEAHNNKELWGDPEVFRPERFLSEDGRQFVKREGFMSFSTGKRVCLGEKLARDELFLFTSSLFQVFHVATDPSAPPPSLEPHVGGVLMTKPHKLVLTLRHEE